MRIPNWFLVVVAVCLAVAAGSFAFHMLRPEHDWQRVGDSLNTFDRKTDEYCNLGGRVITCINLQKGGEWTKAEVTAPASARK